MINVNTVLAEKKLNSSSTLLIHLKALVQRKSITPNDAGCQQYIQTKLRALGFTCHSFQVRGVNNLIASIGHGSRRIAFSGHTDVVPVGDLSQWFVDPFSAELVDGYIVGRGVADMKGGIAAMLSAITQQVAAFDLNKYTFYFLLTSDEEGEAEFGTKAIVARLAEQGQLPHLCIVGEPSASQCTGDVIKVGRRGAISGEITIQGRQGHVAYPKQAINAAHIAASIAHGLANMVWDCGCDDFPGTTLQVTAIETGTWTDNVIPGQSKVAFNVRYSHRQTQQSIEQQVVQQINQQMSKYHAEIGVEWLRPCGAYLTENVPSQGMNLISEIEQAIYKTCHLFPRLSTSGGTSDGRFFAQAGCQVVELGVPNKSIHQINEKVKLTDLMRLEAIYGCLLQQLMC